MQDVFMILYRRWDELEFTRSPRPWLFGAARRVAAAHRRKAARHQRRVAAVDAVGSSGGSSGGIGADLHEQVASREALARLHEVLAELDERLAVVFVLADIEGQSGPEIAELLGVKLNSIYSRLRNARARVEAAMASPDQDGGAT